MNIFDNVDTSELLERYGDLMSKYVKIAKELAPRLESFGKLRQELQAITLELASRNAVPEDSKDLVDDVKKEIDKRGIST